MKKNVSGTERVMSGSVGLFLLLRALRSTTKSRSIFPATRLLSGTVGADLLWRGITGHCALYERLDIDSTKRFGKTAPENKGPVTVCINKPLEDIRSMLRDADWDGCRVRTGEEADHYTVTFAGTSLPLRITSYGDGKRYIMAIDLPDGTTETNRIARLVFSPSIRVLASTALRNIKAMIETGEVATISGQPHGRRSLIGRKAASASEKIHDKVDSLTTIYGQSQTEVVSAGSRG